MPVSSDVEDAIIQASRKTGVPVALLTAIAYIESGLGRNQRGVYASGLFQFIPGTWSRMLSKYGAQYGIPMGTSPFDVRASALMAAVMIKYEGYPAAASVVGNPSYTDIYLTHHEGSAGGRKFLQYYMRNPDTPMSVLHPSYQVLKANAWVTWYGGVKTVGQVYQEYTNLLAAGMGKGRAIIAADRSPAPVVAKAPVKQAATPPVMAKANPKKSYSEHVKVGSIPVRVRANG
jgi:hypothetical protein